MPVLRDGKLYLYGFVGDNFWDEGFLASEVIDALIEVGRETPIDVHINSGGGYTDDGVAIFNALSAHKGEVTIIVDAMAASSASLIAMAGDIRIMRTGSLMMMHDPSGITWGTADDHAKRLEHLDKLGSMMAGIYADVIDDAPDDFREEMKETLWLTPDEAVERGFATGSDVEESEDVAAFDYRVYAQAPDRLCALAKTNAWSLKKALAKKDAAPAAPETGQKGETALSEKKPVGKEPAKIDTVAEAEVTQSATDDAVQAAVKADRGRRSEIMALDESKGREPLAEELFASDMSVEQIKAALAKAPAGGSDKPDTDPDAYEKDRVEGNGLAQPVVVRESTKAKLSPKAIYANRAQQVKGTRP